jgi:hypothetical protein
MQCESICRRRGCWPMPHGEGWSGCP